MSDLDDCAMRIAEAAAAAWWAASAGNDDAIPLGVVAALALMTKADPAGPDPSALVLGADKDELADLLRHIWRLFAIVRPELCIRVGPFAAWLEDPTHRQLDGALATARAVVRAGQLRLTLGPEQACAVDLLGCVYQQFCSPGPRKIHGDEFTPTDVANLLAQETLVGVQSGDSICDEAAGTGGLLRAAARTLRLRGIAPHAMRWYANDANPIAVAGLAVNTHLWGLGRHVVVGCADLFAEPDWELRAKAEQLRAADEHNGRALAAQLLVLDRRISRSRL